MSYFVEILLHSGVRFTITKMSREDFDSLNKGMDEKAKGTLRLNGIIGYTFPHSSVSMITWQDMEDEDGETPDLMAEYPESIGPGELEKSLVRLSQEKDSEE
jgi:hypothetical protein